MILIFDVQPKQLYSLLVNLLKSTHRTVYTNVLQPPGSILDPSFAKASCIGNGWKRF